MKAAFFAGLSAVALLSACSKPAAVQPEQQTAAATAAAAAAAPASPVQAVPLDTRADGTLAKLPGAAALPADQTTPQQAAEAQSAAAAAGLPVTQQTRTSFSCDNGEEIEVRFFPDQGVAVLVRGGENVELQGEPVASGFKYSNGQTTVQGKGDELMLNVGMMATATCTAKAA